MLHDKETGRGEEQQDRRVTKPGQAENQQPQKCPRCDSYNTKFCYYNNYSLSQPRYFCKTCRRYWTQGGTLRNVPVGGGCRKGKRTKPSTSDDNSRPQQSQPPPTQPQQILPSLSNAQALLSQKPGVTTATAASSLRIKEPDNNLGMASSIPSMHSYYQGGGFLSSLATIHSMNQPQSFNPPVNVSTGFGGSSNMALLQGFNVVPNFGSQQYQQIQQGKSMDPFYPSQESLIHPSKINSSSHQDWHHNFINTSNPNPSESGLWNISTAAAATATASNSDSNTIGSSMNPNQWPNLPGYGPPP